MVKIFKYIYYKTFFGKILIYIYHNSKNRLIPEKILEKNKYRRIYGVYPDLKNPKTLNEKIVWLKLNDRTPLHTTCADKYEVRSYVKERIGEEYLIPLLYKSKNPKDIVFNNIPDEPVVIKTNHDSGGVIFVRDKTSANWSEIQKNLKRRLNTNYYWRSKEWQYKNIKPMILVEKLIQDESGNIPFDFKLHCFNGKVNMIQVDMWRGTNRHCRNWYSPDWKKEPYKWTIPLGNGKFTDPCDKNTDKPNNLDEMISLSEKLAKPFRYARVDWYYINGQLLFGEITFHHDGGFRPIEPSEWDLKLGQKLLLS